MIAVIDQVKSIGEDESARSEVYSLLGALLVAPPAQEVLTVVSRIGSTNEAVSGGLAKAWEDLRRAGEQAEPGDLEAEYQELFIGIGRGELVPYGSWYLTGFMMDQPLATLRQDLKILGFERQENITETEDHIAALCETMSMIIAAHSEIEFQTQKKFFDDHLGCWGDLFFKDLQNAKAANFYRPVGQLGTEFMAFEKQYLNMSV